MSEVPLKSLGRITDPPQYHHIPLPSDLEHNKDTDRVLRGIAAFRGIPEREIFVDNLLVRVHMIIEMILEDRPCATGD